MGGSDDSLVMKRSLESVQDSIRVTHSHTHTDSRAGLESVCEGKKQSDKSSRSDRVNALEQQASDRTDGSRALAPVSSVQLKFKSTERQ